MLRIRECFVFGLILALADAQRQSAADPRPTNEQRPLSSYSDFPGRIQNPLDIDNPTSGQSRGGPNSFHQDASAYSAMQNNPGTISIPAASSSSYSSFPRNTGPKPPAVSNSYSSFQGNVGPANIPVDSSIYPSTLNRGRQNVPLSASAPMRGSQNGPLSASAPMRGSQNVPLSASAPMRGSQNVPPSASVPMRDSQNVPPRASAPNRGGQSVSSLAASELAQGIKKPKPPLSTGTDTWTPMGHLGTGQPWDPMPPKAGTGNQQLPYDTSKTSITIGEQIEQQLLKKQQQQQQQQQYDIFGFPINNSPDLFGLTPTTDLFAPLSASPDPFFGMFGGVTGGSSQGGRGGLNQGGSGGSSGHGPAGEFLQMMLMMQLMGGADAPDPQPRGRGRGRGAGASLTPMSAMEQLIRLEEIRMMRNRQRQRVNRNRGLPQNRRSGSLPQGPNAPKGANSGSFDTAYDIPRPPPTKTSSTVLRPRSSPTRTKSRANRRPVATHNSLHPAVLDRRNMPPTPAPTQPGHEPVEREGQPQGQASSQGQTQPTAPPRELFERPRTRGFNVRRAPSSALGGNNVGYQNYNTFDSSVQRQTQQQSSIPITIGGRRRGQRFPGQPSVPRNMRQLMTNPLFQRRLRVAGSTPGANPADVRADQADLMADRADNLQSMSPLQRLLGAGALGGQGLPGLQIGQRGTRATGTGISPAARLSSLASLFGGGGSGGLLSLGMLGGGLGI